MEFKETVTLGELSVEGKGSYGIAASAVDFNEKLPTYLRITDISEDGYLLRNSLKSVDDPNAKKYILKPNDIVFARTGNSTGKSYFYESSEGELIYAGFLIKFSLDENKVNPKFIRYYTLSEQYKGWVKGFSTGSTRGNINAKSYASMQISLPPRKYQDFAVNVLSSLEEKYKMNKIIISKLEEIVQSLFKHWFVDFNFPNEEGVPYKSGGGELIESGNGIIPKGWGHLSLYEIANYINGASFKSNDFDLQGLPVIKIAELKNGITSQTKFYSKNDKADKYIIKDKDILFSWSGNPETSIDTFIWVKSKALLNQHIFKIESKGIFSKAYLYALYKYMKPIFTRIASNKQTTGLGHVTLNDLKRLNVILPSELIIKEFESIINPIFESIFMKMKENENLVSLRNSLLPKLLSGEIELPNETEVTEHVPIS